MEFELRRGAKHATETVFRGSESECIEWAQSAILRNRYSVTVLTDLNMRPVFSCVSKYGTKKCFYLIGVK